MFARLGGKGLTPAIRGVVCAFARALSDYLTRHRAANGRPRGTSRRPLQFIVRWCPLFRGFSPQGEQ
jgi:hypothetical protein